MHELRAMLPELIQTAGHIHFLKCLTHIIERGGANSIALINHRVSLSAERLHIYKWILFIHLGGIFPHSAFDLLHINWLLSFEALLIHRGLTAPDRLP